VSNPGGTTNPCSRFRLLSCWLESKLVGKSEVEGDGDGERERFGAGMVGDVDRERLWGPKIGASSSSEEESMTVERLGREGETEREVGCSVGGRGAGGDARELGGCPTRAVN
jgi:hypothetical protein